MKVASIKVLSELFYSRAIGRLDISGRGGIWMSDEEGDKIDRQMDNPYAPASTHVTDDDEPTLPKMKLAPPPSAPKASMRFDDLNNQTRACKTVMKQFIADNINQKNIQSKNVKYVHDMMMSINSALELIIASLEPGWPKQAETLRGCLDHLDEANIAMGGKKAVTFMNFSGYDSFHMTFLAVMEILGKVVREQLSSPEFGQGSYELPKAEVSVA